MNTQPPLRFGGGQSGRGCIEQVEQVEQFSQRDVLEVIQRLATLLVSNLFQASDVVPPWSN